MSNTKHPTCWLAVSIYVVILALLSWAIVRFDLPDSLLLIYVVPCVLSAFFYGRQVYWAMIVTLAVAAIWVTARVSSSFVTSLLTIAMTSLSGLAMAESVRALVTARARAEEALDRYRDHLEELVQTRTAEVQTQYAQLGAILNSVGDAICMTDPEWRILYINPAFTTLTGYLADEVLGQDMRAIGVLVDFPLRLPAISPVLGQGKLWQGEMAGRRKDGRNYTADLIVAPVHDDAGQASGYVFTHHDISQAKDLEHARDQFITNVSHQFLTPLTPLKTGIYLLRRTLVPEKQQQQLEAMETAIDWLIHLIKDTLEISTLDSGKGVTVWEPVSLPSLVDEVLKRHQGQAQKGDLTLTAAPIPADLPPVQGDPARLAQALSELVENAVTFTPAGGQVSVAVRAETIEGESWITVAVQDNGPGITAEELPRLFERFFRGRLAESGHIAGIGLGLGIAQKIAQAHGGDITVASTVGEGSTFTLWLRSAAGDISP